MNQAEEGGTVQDGGQESSKQAPEEVETEKPNEASNEVEEYQSLRDLANQAVTSKELPALPSADLVRKIADWTAHDAIDAVPPDDDLHDDLYDDDFKLPEVNWENLEVKLRESALEESLKQSQRHNYNVDREEIRRKLAMVSSSSSSSSSNDPTITVQLGGNNPPPDDHLVMPDYLTRTSRRSKPPYMSQNLQICFMNESINDDSTTENGGDEYRLEHFNDKIIAHSNSQGSLDDSDLNHEDDDDDDQLDELNLAQRAHTKSSGDNSNAACLSVAIPAFTFTSSNAATSATSSSSREDVLLKLQSEAKQALAQVRLQVKQKLEAERNIVTKPSPIADIVGLPTYGLARLERDQIVDMNIGQLQVIVNDLCNQIEKINEELKKMLIERDDLFMQQDAILVDIEDFTKRIEELSAKKQANELNTASAAGFHSTTSPSSSASQESCQSLPDHQNQLPSKGSNSSSFTPQSISNKVTAFFSSHHYYSDHHDHDQSGQNVKAAASSSSKPKLFSSFANKLYKFKK